MLAPSSLSLQDSSAAQTLLELPVFVIVPSLFLHEVSSQEEATGFEFVVGAGVGAGDGSTVGNGVGLSVGSEVGPGDGSGDGTGVGLPVGSADGTGVGLSVGGDVGS